MAANLPPDVERRAADAMRDALERFEEAQRAALKRLRNDLQIVLWPEPETPAPPE